MEELLYEKWLLCKARIGYKAKSKRITGLIIKTVNFLGWVTILNLCCSQEKTIWKAH